MVLGLGFVLTPVIIYNLNFKIGSSIQSSDYKDDINLDSESLRFSKGSKKIYLNGNSDWSAAKAAGICTGSGTESDPYVIEDLIIDCEGSGNFFWIQDSSVYFKIENCTIYNAGEDGIKFRFVDNG